MYSSVALISFVSIYFITYMATPYSPKVCLIVAILYTVLLLFYTFRHLLNKTYEEKDAFERRYTYFNILTQTALLGAYFLNITKIIDFDLSSFKLDIIETNKDIYYTKLVSFVIPEILFLTLAFVVITFSIDFISKAENLLEHATQLDKIKEEIKKIPDSENFTSSLLEKHLRIFKDTLCNLTKRDFSKENIEEFFDKLHAFMEHSSKSIEGEYANELFRKNIESIKIKARNAYIDDHNLRYNEKKGYLATFELYSTIVSYVIDEFKEKKEIEFFTTFTAPLNEWFEKPLIRSQWSEYLTTLKNAINDGAKLQRALLYIEQNEETRLNLETARNYFKKGINDDDKISEFCSKYHSKYQRSNQTCYNSFVCCIHEKTLREWHPEFLKDFFVVCYKPNKTKSNNNTPSPVISFGIAENSNANAFELVFVDFTNNDNDEKYEKYIKDFMKNYKMNDSNNVLVKGSFCECKK